MNHKEKLIQVYNESSTLDDSQLCSIESYRSDIQEIADNCYHRKGVYTVLVTLLVHKILHPEQDIRYHQEKMEKGFSGRGIDTIYITPTLKELGLPAMSESGWLTRSLEQPYPYTLNYNGNISPKNAKTAFLRLIDFIEINPNEAEIILKCLLYEVRKIAELNNVVINKISNSEKLNIKSIVDSLDSHFSYDYKTHGASKLPVLAFFAIYQILIKEISRYNLCTLKKLGSHTASDKTSRSAGDIEIFDGQNNLFEAVEIKYDKPITLQMIHNAEDKIIKYNPIRYCIFSSKDVKNDESDKIIEYIHQISSTHGCQIIINGIIPTLKYYLRLIMSLEDFIYNYSLLVETDNELKAIHKTKWNSILAELNSSIDNNIKN